MVGSQCCPMHQTPYDFRGAVPVMDLATHTPCVLSPWGALYGDHADQIARGEIALEPVDSPPSSIT